jgi:type IV secretion system protein VirB9
MKKTLLVLAALAAPAIAHAQTAVPALDAGGGAAVAAAAPMPSGPVYPNTPPPSLGVVMGPNPTLTARDRAGIEIADAWAENRTRPATGTEGAAMFTFGETLPSIVCAPLFVCDVMLQPGEIINDINLGDAVRWKVSPARSGSGADAVTHILLKPTDAGVTTNLVVTTDRRTYVLKLVSHRTEWMPRVAFSYPDDVRREWEDFLANQRTEQAVAAARAATVQTATVLPTGEPLATLDFGFDVRGDSPAWRPLRVYSDGQKTYIQFPPEMVHGQAPALVGLGAGDAPEIINYRADGDRYVVDQVLERAALISGVGRRQDKVEIVRSGRR